MARPEAFFKVMAAEASLKHYLPLVEKVIGESRARIFQAQTRHPDKILSLFEPHSVVIRKGEAHKPNEFGRLVRIDEVETAWSAIMRWPRATSAISNSGCLRWKHTWSDSVEHLD